MTKVTRNVEAFSNEVIRIRWFIVEEGGYLDEEVHCPSKRARRSRDAKRNRAEKGQTENQKGDINKLSNNED